MVETVADGAIVLFVGTKKQAQDAIREEAERCEHVLRQPPLAGRHAHQLPDHQRLHRRLEEVERM